MSVSGHHPNTQKEKSKAMKQPELKIRIQFDQMHQKLEDKVRKFVVSSLISEHKSSFGTIFTDYKKDDRKDIRAHLEDCFITVQQVPGQMSSPKSLVKLKAQVHNLSCGGICISMESSERPRKGSQVKLSLPFLGVGHLNSVRGLILETSL